MNGWKYRVSGSNTYQHNVRTPEGLAEHSKFEQRSGLAFLSYDFNDHFTVGGSYEQFYSLHGRQKPRLLAAPPAF